MRLLGLTGGIGMGKSTAGELLKQQGVSVVDTDVLARKIVEPGQAAVEDIRSKFGTRVFSPDGRLNRHEMARIVFFDSSALKELENILHPRIRTAWQFEVTQWRERGVPIGVVTIPLLFETKAQSLFDFTICCACSNNAQMTRLVMRGWSVEEVEKRIAAQMKIEEKMKLSDFVVWTDFSLEIHQGQLEKILNTIQQREI